MCCYRVFTRNWWKENPSWPDGLEPDGAARKGPWLRGMTLEQARLVCERYNATHDPGRLGHKAEFEREGRY